jgi:hypothetical protein
MTQRNSVGQLPCRKFSFNAGVFRLGAVIAVALATLPGLGAEHGQLPGFCP